MYDGLTGGVVAKKVSIVGVTLAGRPTNSALTDMRGSATPIVLSNVTVEGAGFPGASGIVLDGATDISINGLIIKDLAPRPGNRGLSLANAAGTVVNVRFINVRPADRVADGSLGLARPAFPGRRGAFVQNLSLARSGSGSPKEVATGWINADGGTTWNDGPSLVGH